MGVYEVTLPKWKAGLRRALVKSVQWESTVIADMQVGRLVFSVMLMSNLTIGG